MSLQPLFTLSMTLSQTDVYPAKTSGDNRVIVTVRVTSSNGADVSGQLIQFSSDPQELSGGHNHSGGRPTGTFSQSSCTTGPDGTCSVVYSASEVGGIEKITGVIAGNSPQQASQMLNVKVPSLVDLSGNLPLGLGANFRLTGSLAAHPSNHFLTSPALIATSAVVDDFLDEFQATLGLNDMSLEGGGLFDVGPTVKHPEWELWQTPHGLHREGRSVDVDQCALSTIANNPNRQGSCDSGWITVPKPRFKEICELWGGSLVIESTIHCEFKL